MFSGVCCFTSKLHKLSYRDYFWTRTYIMNGPSYYEFYRRSTVGATLADALDTLIVDQRIQPQLAMKVLENFDRVTSERLRTDVKAKMSFKGHLSTYRFCDDVWTFVIKDVVMKLDGGESIDVGKFKIVACNSKKSGE